MKSYAALFATCILVTSASAQIALLGKNLFPEGGFETFAESRLVPIGWSFPNPQDRPWEAGFRAEAVKSEAGGRELKIVNPEGSGATMVTARFRLPPKLDRLRINYRILPKAIELGAADAGGNGAGIYLRFYGKDGKALRTPQGWVSGMIKSADTEWLDREEIYTVSEEAYEIELQIALRSAKGEIRVDDVEVVPLSISE